MMFLPPSHRSRRSGMSVTELLVALALVMVLALLVSSVFYRATQRSRTAACLQVMRNWVGLVNTYVAEHGAYPPTISTEPGNHYWYTLITTYQKDRSDLACPQPREGKLEPIAYNIYFGWALANVDPSTVKYKKVRPAMVQQPGSTFLFADGNALKQPDGSGWAFVRKIRTSYKFNKHNGGSNWVFADGHGEWLTEAEATERGGAGGDAYPFVRPF